MKKLLLAAAFVAATANAAEINPNYWIVNDQNVPLVQEDREGLQLLSFERCGLGGAITVYDGTIDYQPGKVFTEIKMRVDRASIHTFTDVVIDESVMGKVKAVMLADETFLKELEAGTTLRVQYNGKLVETYSLIGFVRTTLSAGTPDWCKDLNRGSDYFEDTNGTEYFRS